MQDSNTELKELEQAMKDMNKALQEYINMIKINRVYSDLHNTPEDTSSTK
jgi:hypothetical protein